MIFYNIKVEKFLKERSKGNKWLKENDVLELKKQIKLHNVKIKTDIFSYFSTKQNITMWKYVNTK